MIGYIQKVLLNLVEASAGAEAVAEVRRRAQVPPERTFRIDSVYDDDEWRRLLNAACDVLGISREQAETAYAEFFIGDARKRFPTWFAMSTTGRQFLERQPTIHNTFATGVRDPAMRKGIEDKFRIERREHEIVTHYRSPNAACGLYKALARVILDQYGDKATIDEDLCTKRGDSECVIRICWESGPRP